MATKTQNMFSFTIKHRLLHQDIEHQLLEDMLMLKVTCDQDACDQKYHQHKFTYKQKVTLFLILSGYQKNYNLLFIAVPSPILVHYAKFFLLDTRFQALVALMLHFFLIKASQLIEYLFLD